MSPQFHIALEGYAVNNPMVVKNINIFHYALESTHIYDND